MSALRAAVEWHSVSDTRRLVLSGQPDRVWRGHRSDLPRAKAHLRVIAESTKEDVLAMCDQVENEDTSGPTMFERIDAGKRGEEPLRPHDDAKPLSYVALYRAPGG